MRSTSQLLRLYSAGRREAWERIHLQYERDNQQFLDVPNERQGTGPSPLALTRSIFPLLLKIEVRITVRHTSGFDNGLMDALSRMEATGDYSLRHAMMNRLFSLRQHYILNSRATEVNNDFLYV
jgi:hypothetical protein